jgi:hypothetical protein
VCQHMPIQMLVEEVGSGVLMLHSACTTQLIPLPTSSNTPCLRRTVKLWLVDRVSVLNQALLLVLVVAACYSLQPAPVGPTPQHHTISNSTSLRTNHLVYPLLFLPCNHHDSLYHLVAHQRAVLQLAKRHLP